MRSIRTEHLLFALAALLLAGSATWFGFVPPRQQPRASATRLMLIGGDYQAASLTAPTTKPEIWSAPPAQKSGREWVYEVFTPPSIFYDARSQRFSVTPPTPAVELTPPPPPFGLELVRVERPLFPLQLVGYVGTGRNLRGIFENVVTGETFLGGDGGRVDSLGLSIVSIKLIRTPVDQEENSPILATTAVAEVRDRATASVVELNSRERHYVAAPSAWVRLAGSDEDAREMKVGDEWSTGEAVFRLEHIDLAAAAVVVTKLRGGEHPPEQQTLTALAATPATLPSHASL